MDSIGLIFITGLTTGGLSCLVVQGGLLTSVVANQGKAQGRQDKLNVFVPMTMFLISKFIAYTLLGMFLGLVGSFLTLSLTVKVAFQILTALFMLATAANLLNIHPIFRYVVFQPPRFLRSLIRKESKAHDFFAPLVLGVMTIFIPCGVTQAMEVLAISTGSIVLGGLTMAVFTLGTMPIFFLVGAAVTTLSNTWQTQFYRVAAALLIVMSLSTINGALQVMDAPISAQKLRMKYEMLKRYEAGEEIAPKVEISQDGVQKVNLIISNRGYTPDYFKVKAGVPVELKLKTNGSYSCANAFTMRAFKIYAQLQPTDEDTFTFTPTEKGKYTFACSMGMYTGVMEVI